MKLSHINHDEKIYTAVFLNFILTSRIKVNSVCYGVKMPRVGTDTMLNLLVPLPPLTEQKRIVAKLEQLLPLCDELGKECK